MDTTVKIDARDVNLLFGVFHALKGFSLQFDDNSVYMTIGTLESYVPIRAHFGAETMIPVYLEVEDVLRLELAIARETLRLTK